MVIRYLKDSVHKCIVYKNKNSNDSFIGYCDADFAADTETCKCVNSYVFEVFGLCSQLYC